MKDSKLLYFLHRISDEEFSAFQQYVDSPLFNRRNALKRLLKVLGKYRDLEPPLPSREEIYKKVYGKQPFNERSLRTGMAQLFALLRDFLAFQQYQKDEVAQQRYLLEKTFEIQAEKFFIDYYEKACKNLERNSLYSADRHLERMLLEELNLEHATFYPTRNAEEVAEQAEFHLMTSFIARFLRYELQRVTAAGNFKARGGAAALRRSFIDKMVGELSDLPPTVRVYALLLRALEHPEDEIYFFKAREILSRAHKDFSFTESSELYTATLNYATRKINQGQREFLHHSFAIYMEMLDAELLTKRGELYAPHFKNILNTALRLEKFEWAGEFLATWRHKIYPDHAENAFHFNQGMLHFYKAEYAEAATCFHRVLQDYKDVFYGLNASGYLLQIYYELGETQSLESIAHALRVRLGRSKMISDAKREQYLSFIRYLLRLMNTPLQDRKRLEKLREDIQANKKGMGTKWLLEKIAALL
ncbi:MAG: hypothetical protein AAF570_17995 [Bacteroidota bacterium]